MDPAEAAGRWADVWQRAWEAEDTEAIVALYHEDVVFSTQPFRVPYLRRSVSATTSASRSARRIGRRCGSGRRWSVTAAPRSNGGRS